MAATEKMSWFGATLGEGNRPQPTGLTRILIDFASLALLAYLVWYALWGATDPHLNSSIFLTVAIPIAFLTTTWNRRTAKIGLGDWLLAAFSVVIFGYFVWNNDFYTDIAVGMVVIPLHETVIGLIAIALTIELTRRATGWGLTSLALLLLAYTAWGEHLGGELGHAPITMDYFITMMTLTDMGLFGDAIDAAATYAILFITFGTFFQRTNGGTMFFELAAAVTKGQRGGASKACVVSSGLFGSISGSPVADVVTTGPITIPLMKEAGVAPTRAAGLEATASSGGAILPPVMGAVAFLMVAYTGIPYHEIALAALIPGLLYYLGVLTCAHFEALRTDEKVFKYEGRLLLGPFVRAYWSHIGALFVLAWLLISGYGAAYVAGISLLVLLALNIVNPDRTHRLTIASILDGCGETMRQVAGLATTVAVAGVILGCISLAGLTGKFSVIMSAIGGTSLIVTLIIAAIILILFGAGLPVATTYLMGVALVAPQLIQQFSIPLMESHLFLVYFACLSGISPPIAVTCFAAATIADADPMDVGWYSCKAAFAGFLLPFYFVLNNGILIQGSVGHILWDTLIGCVLMGTAAMALFWPFKAMKGARMWRLVFAAASAALMAPVPAFQAAIAIAALLTGFLLFKYQSSPMLAPERK